VTHPFTSVPTTLVNTVGVAVTTVGAGFTPARSGARGSTQPAYLSEGDTRVAALRLGSRDDPQQCNNEVRGTHVHVNNESMRSVAPMRRVAPMMIYSIGWYSIASDNQRRR